MRPPEVDTPPQTFLLNRHKVCSHSERTEEWKINLYLSGQDISIDKKLVSSNSFSSDCPLISGEMLLTGKLGAIVTDNAGISVCRLTWIVYMLPAFDLICTGRAKIMLRLCLLKTRKKRKYFSVTLSLAFYITCTKSLQHRTILSDV